MMGGVGRTNVGQPGTGGYLAARTLASIYKRIGDEQKAIAMYRRALEDNPGDYQSLAGLGAMLVHRDAPGDVRSALESLVDTTSEDMLFTLSHIFSQGGHYGISLSYLDKLDDITSNPERVAFLRGECLLNSKKYREAIVSLKKVPPPSTFYSEALMNRAICYLLLGEHKDAAETLDPIKDNEELSLTYRLYSLAIGPMGGRIPIVPINSWQREATCQIIADLLRKLLRLGELEAFAKAVTLLEELGILPGEVSLLLGKIYYDAGYSEVAIEELISAYEDGYADGEAFFMLGRMAIGNGFYEEAKTFLIEALGRGIEELTLYVSLGRALIELGETDWSLEVLDMGDKKYPSSPLIAKVRQSIGALV
jgi:tetratricopeptide (TPR) repeat protein